MSDKYTKVQEELITALVDRVGGFSVTNVSMEYGERAAWSVGKHRSIILDEIIEICRADPWNTDLEAAKQHDGRYDLWVDRKHPCRIVDIITDAWIERGTFLGNKVLSWKPADTGPTLISNGSE